jgi:hypothetical protein
MSAERFCKEISSTYFLNIQTNMTIIYSNEKDLYTGKLTSLSSNSKFEDFMQDYFSLFIG